MPACQCVAMENNDLLYLPQNKTTKIIKNIQARESHRENDHFTINILIIYFILNQIKV